MKVLLIPLSVLIGLIVIIYFSLPSYHANIDSRCKELYGSEWVGSRGKYLDCINNVGDMKVYK